MKYFRKNMIVSAVAASMLLGASAANANLIINGGFEAPEIEEGTWDHEPNISVPGWEGSNVEIWNHNQQREAYEGDQFAELNSHPDSGDFDSFTLFQEFNTSVGEWYDVSFAYKARNNAEESFLFDVFSGDHFDEWLIDDHTTSDWSVFEGGFEAGSELSRITFTAVNPQGTEGNFLDDVSVTASVPEPGTLALLGLGLAGLGISRRRQVK